MRDGVAVETHAPSDKYEEGKGTAMNELLRFAVDHALAGGASYAEARFAHQQHNVLHVQDGRLSGRKAEEFEGISVRVLKDGAWGAAGGDYAGREAAGRHVHQALAAAGKPRSPHTQPVLFPPRPGVRVSYTSPVRRDPFALSLEEKFAFAARVLDGLVREGRRLDLKLEFIRETKLVENSEGSSLDQHFTYCGADLNVRAEGNGTVASRHFENFRQAGFEFLEGMRLKEVAETLVREAEALLSAPACPEGVFPVILNWDHMAMLLHETVGHNLELDRILGLEKTFAGHSFVQVSDLGSYPYASPAVSIVADATTPEGAGTYAVDDEGVPAQVTDLVRDGVVAGFLSSRECAAAIGAPSSGAARGALWEAPPLVRMTNINLLPGHQPFEALLAGIKHGLYLAGPRSWSIGADRRNYHLASQVAYEIVDGKLGRVLRGAAYQGDPNDLWRRCEAVGDQPVLFGVAGCGKGELMQMVAVGHSTPPARFADMRVRCLL
jgi:TldD protein